MNDDSEDRRFEWKYGVKPGSCRTAIAAGVCFLAAVLIMVAAVLHHL